MVRLGVSHEEVLADYRRLVALPEREDIVPALYRRKDGSTFPGEARRTVLDTRDGPILVVTAHDLTERKRAEERQVAHARQQEHRALRPVRPRQARRRGCSEAGAERARRSERETVVYWSRPGRRELMLRALGWRRPARATPGSSSGARTTHRRRVREPRAGALHGEQAVTLPFAGGWACGSTSALVMPVRGERSARGLLCAFSRAGAFGAEETDFLGAAGERAVGRAAAHRQRGAARLPRAVRRASPGCPTARCSPTGSRR